MAKTSPWMGELDFRYNERSVLGVDETERTAKTLKGIVGKRFTYRRINEVQDHQAEG